MRRMTGFDRSIDQSIDCSSRHTLKVRRQTADWLRERTAMSTQHAEGGAVVLTVDADVAVISLNRPQRLNAVNDELVEALLDALSEVEAGECGAAVLAGRGRAFCAGHDLKEPHGEDAGLL